MLVEVCTVISESYIYCCDVRTSSSCMEWIDLGLSGGKVTRWAEPWDCWPQQTETRFVGVGEFFGCISNSNCLSCNTYYYGVKTNGMVNIWAECNLWLFNVHNTKHSNIGYSSRLSLPIHFLYVVKVCRPGRSISISYHFLFQYQMLNITGKL